jgi:hypothetical protein
MTEKRPNPAEVGLTPRQEKALAALLTCVSHEQAAAQSGITTRSLRRYLADPAFSLEYRTRRKELMGQAVALAQRFSLDCIEVMVSIAKDVDMLPNTRVTAANSVFSIADDGLKTEDVIARIEALEGMFNEQLEKTPSQNGAVHASRKF